jgi:hypothetical protein
VQLLDIRVLKVKLLRAVSAAGAWQEWGVVIVVAVGFTTVSRYLLGRAEKLAKQQGLSVLLNRNQYCIISINYTPIVSSQRLPLVIEEARICLDRLIYP